MSDYLNFIVVYLATENSVLVDVITKDTSHLYQVFAILG